MTRARTTAGIGALAAAAVLGITALAVAGTRSGDEELSSSPVRASVTPSTIEVRTTAPASPGPAATSAPAAGPTASTSPPRSTGASTTTTLPRSPLGDLVGDPVSVLPAPVAAVAAPVRIAIGAIDVDVPIRPVGVAPDGQLEIPDETEVGWYRLGSSPGEAGSSVLAGHVSWNRTTGPFLRLATLEPGVTVDVTLEDGTVRTYEVIERAEYGKLELPADRIWAQDGPETLVLITCGGEFNPEIRRYASNIVVYAVPVA